MKSNQKIIPILSAVTCFVFAITHIVGYLFLFSCYADFSQFIEILKSDAFSILFDFFFSFAFILFGILLLVSNNRKLLIVPSAFYLLYALSFTFSGYFNFFIAVEIIITLFLIFISFLPSMFSRHSVPSALSFLAFIPAVLETVQFFYDMGVTNSELLSFLIEYPEVFFEDHFYALFFDYISLIVALFFIGLSVFHTIRTKSDAVSAEQSISPVSAEENASFCSSCGAKLKQNAHFCPKCGAKQ